MVNTFYINTSHMKIVVLERIRLDPVVTATSKNNIANDEYM